MINLLHCVALWCDGRPDSPPTATPAKNTTDLKSVKHWITNLWLFKFRKVQWETKPIWYPFHQFCVLSVISFKSDYQIIKLSDQWWSKRKCDQYAIPSLPPRSENLCHRGRATCAAQIPQQQSQLFMEAVIMPDNLFKAIKRGEVVPRNVIPSNSCRTSETNMNLQLGEYQHLSKLIKTYQNLSKLEVTRF